jgi:oxygen-independent coproporphyrinogen-3 oxidase
VTLSPLPPLGLYIHLPWCERKCPYCDFNSHEVAQIPQDDYVEALLRDLDADLPDVQGREISSIFIGGGTPSLFTPQAIGRLLQGVDKRLALAPDVEVTMEANPGSAEAGRFAGYRAAGVNRLSLGIQSFDDTCLQALGRVHNAEQAHAAIDAARAAGFMRLNLDLMHGLPQQDAAGAQQDLLTALEHDPDHLSWYQLTLEPNTVFYKRPPPLPVEDELADIQRSGELLIAEAGYAQYEVSAYSRAGSECRHNLNYWQFGDYLGIGAGAHGKISYPDGRIARYSKRRQPQEYLQSEQRRSAQRLLDEDEIPGEFMLNALRLRAGFAPALYREHTGRDAASMATPLRELEAQGLLEVSEHNIRTSELGSRFLDTVIGQFFPD